MFSVDIYKEIYNAYADEEFFPTVDGQETGIYLEFPYIMSI